MESVRKHKKHSYQKGVAYSRLTLTGRTSLQARYGQQRRFVEAECICGVTKWYLFESLTRGETKSCGCLRNELRKTMRVTHGMRNHPLYMVYRGMKERCYNRHHIGYKNYGGRGISVCDEWLEKPILFFTWALENGWINGLDIDRENNDGDYGPNNCRFVPPSTNSKNRRTTRLITAFGETKCLKEWAEDPRCKVSMTVLHRRDKSGEWDNKDEMIVAPPTKRNQVARTAKNVRLITAFGETKCLAAWLEDERCKVSSGALRKRLKKGWCAEAALSEEKVEGNFNKNKDRNIRLSSQPVVPDLIES